MNDINYSEIGNKIKQKRRELGYSQEELAEICGISASYIGHIERGSKKDVYSYCRFYRSCTSTEP